MSVSSFIHFHGTHLVHFAFDPFHRLIRDMKLDVAGIGPKTLRQKLLQAQLCSAFVWGVNYRPYGSGAFASSKKEVLEHFLSTEYEDRPLFFLFNGAVGCFLEEAVSIVGSSICGGMMANFFAVCHCDF